MGTGKLDVVTGAFGYTGKYITERLLSSGRSVRTFEELVHLIAEAIGTKTRIVHAPAATVLATAWLVGLIVNDVVVNRDELGGPIANLVVTDGPATGERLLSEWLTQKADVVGKRCASEVSRHYRTSRARTER